MSFGKEFEHILLQSTHASAISGKEVIQGLWSGYGKILRVTLDGGSVDSVIAKHIQLPEDSRHPRGWNTDFSHQRKVRSYEVETEWYRTWASRCDDDCRVPGCLASEIRDGEIFLVLEDLDAAGFPLRHTSVTSPQIELCLRWLANFHAKFVDEKPVGLWETGTYWHLETRPDELEALDDALLKQAAPAIDARLNSAKYQTFVHGDAKLANFCFSADDNNVAAVDFQYTGGGCGMKDVAYFIGSCLDETECERQETELLACYFEFLATALKKHKPEIKSDELINEWRELFPFAWADFHRFLKGWCPGHWKINGYSERVSREVVKSLNLDHPQ